MITFPSAKINLGLNVLRRRNDGFHDIDTVMFPIGLYDILEIIPSDTPGVDFSQSGLIISGNPSDNLCVKAYHLMNRKNGFGGIRMHLHKVIPPGSGLGGGSSDAAKALLMLNDIFQAGLSRDELMKMAEKLGSDCPFFLLSSPAHATGRGEALELLTVDLKNKWLVLVVPSIHVSTKWAYSRITPGGMAKSPVSALKLDIRFWKDHLVNDFESTVFASYPEIREIKEQLYRMGALYASMSGSGSAVYGIFEEAPGDLRIKFPGLTLWTGPCCSPSP